LDLPVSYNVAPTSQIWAVVSTDDGRRVQDVSWGLIPRWSKDSTKAASLINARLESVSEKPSFKDLIAVNRCVLPMDGYFEWKEVLRHDKIKSSKQPFYFSAQLESRFSHNGVLAVAGLWSSWRDPNEPGGPSVITAVALTRDANAMVGRVHHRMPVLLDHLGVMSWLDLGTRDPLSRLAEIDDDALTVCAVSTRVNSSRNGGAELIDPIDLNDLDNGAHRAGHNDNHDDLRLF
jgi:putative SOS response-associated peptidase YedK